METDTTIYYYDIAGRYSYSRFLERIFETDPKWKRAEGLESVVEVEVTFTDRPIERSHMRFPIYIRLAEADPPRCIDHINSFASRQIGAFIVDPAYIRNVVPGLDNIAEKLSLAQLLEGKPYFLPTLTIRFGKMLNTPRVVDRLMELSPVKMWYLKDSHKDGAKGIRLLPSSAVEIHPYNKTVILTNDSIPQTFQKGILQPALHNPLLLPVSGLSHKFDIRAFILLSFHGLYLDAFLYHECILRIASQPYDPSSRDGICHLTNVCYQTKQNPTADPDRLVRLLSSLPDLHALLFPRIHSVLSDALAAARPLLNTHQRRGFTLLGADLLVDERHKPWLLEFNFSPSMFKYSPQGLAVSERVVKSVAEVVEIIARASKLGCSCAEIRVILCSHEWVACLPHKCSWKGVQKEDVTTCDDNEFELFDERKAVAPR